MIDKYYNKERKYNKIDPISRKKGGDTKGTTKFAKGYENLTWQNRVKKSALIASDNGRCWWIYDYIMRTTIKSTKEPLASHTGLAKELYPSWSKK